MLAPLAAYLIYRLLEGSIHPLLFMPLFAGVLYFQLTIGTEVFATMSVVGLLCALVLLGLLPGARLAVVIAASDAHNECSLVNQCTQKLQCVTRERWLHTPDRVIPR